jgi:hypothetical protein
MTTSNSEGFLAGMTYPGHVHQEFVNVMLDGLTGGSSHKPLGGAYGDRQDENRLWTNLLRPAIP